MKKENTLKRLFSVLIAAVMLAAFAILPVSPVGRATAVPAGACGWNAELPPHASDSSGSWSTWSSQTIYLRAAIVTYNDGCGHKYYVFSTYYVDRNGSYDGTPWTVVDINDSVWVCGQLREHSDIASNQVYSSTYYYGGCGRQASMTAYASSNYVGDHTVTTNQG